MKTKFKGILTLLLVLVAQVAFAQAKIITGTVTDPNGEPILGATVAVENTAIGTSTDFDGKYSIEAEVGSTLVFTYVGYGTIEREVTAETDVINVVMKEATDLLNEVVITGYGSKVRPKSTAASSAVGAEEIENVPIASFEQILQGRAPGILVNAGSGQPGTAAKVRIRGTGSITGNNDPLYIVDGVQIDPSSFATLNPNDFESVNILRDAQATALYGSRGGNGVIVITTKSGTFNKPTTITYNGQYGISVVPEAQFDVMNSEQYLRFGRIIGANNLTDSEIAAQAAEVNTNWRDVFYRTGTTNTHTISARGGGEKTRFFTSAQYFEQEGVLETSDLQRMVVRLNLDHAASDKLSFGINSSTGFSTRNFVPVENGVNLRNPALYAYMGNPTQPLRNDDGSFATGNQRNGANYYELLQTGIQKQQEFKLILSGRAQYDFTDYLNAQYRIGVDYEDDFGQSGSRPGTFVGGTETPGQAGFYSEQNRRDVNFTSTLSLNFNKVFDEVHTVNASLFTETIRRWFRSSNFTGYGLEPAQFGFAAAITPGTPDNELIPVTSGGIVRTGIFSVFGTAGYDYDDRYGIDVSLRNDRSSRFSEDNNSATFWTVGGRWNIDEESFMENVDWIDGLKLRASYGTSGNERAIPPNAAIQQLATGVTYNGIRPLFQGALANESLTWEEASQANIGLDYAFFDSRLTGTVDVYNRSTESLFIQFSTPAYFGVGGLDVNGGEVENRGVEFSVNYDVIRSAADDPQGFNLSVNGNFGYNQNEIVSLGDQVTEFEQGTSIIREGEPIGTHFIVEWAGVNPANGEPLYRDLDGNITNEYSASNNKTGFGQSEPILVGGFGFNASYKGFNLSTLWSFADDFARFNNMSFFIENPNFYAFNQSTDMLDIWQEPGDITDIQGAAYEREFSSKDIEDASFLRLRNVTLGYTLPKSLTDATGFIKGGQIYVQGVNLLTFTEWTGFDPEDNNNIAQFEYPTPRQYTVGLNLNF